MSDAEVLKELFEQLRPWHYGPKGMAYGTPEYAQAQAYQEVKGFLELRRAGYRPKITQPPARTEEGD